MDLTNLTITKTKESLQKKEFSAVELTKAYLERIERTNPEIHAYLTVCEKEALEDARHADRLIAEGQDLPLLGIPFALKDIFLTKGICTTAGSKVLENYIPQYNATVVNKLKDAGAIILGKTNLDAWAHGSSGENSDFEPTRNPYDTRYVPGGSSSGSAAAVAADLALAATGTDTGGSIRLPASFCNVVGLKPTYGRVSRYGIVAMASSLDSIGHFTRTVEDNAFILNVTAGHDEHDATTPPVAVKEYTKELQKGVKGLKIGVPKEYFIAGVDPRITEIIKHSLKFYENEGAEIVDISLPHTEYAIAVYYIVQTAEVSSNLARYDGIRYGSARQNFGDEAKRRIMLGTYVLSAGYYDAYYKKAMQVRTLIKRDFDEAFKNVDVIMTPASPGLPFKIGERTNDPLQMYLSDIFTVTGNLAGVPGLSIPAGFLDGLPVGLQIFAPHFSEDLLYRVAYPCEQEHKYYLERPKF